MALILAVDPEQRQYAALACLARELDGHELLSAPSCADALVALEDRFPDLVLLPILSPDSEEQELLSRLREQAGGAGVRTINIPQLRVPGAASTASPASTQPAWLNQILHPQEETEQACEDCEPAVFADLIKSYLGPMRDAAAEAATAVAEAARAAAKERHARLVAAARAAAAWARNQREKWNAQPPVIAIGAPPLESILPPLTAAPARPARPKAEPPAARVPDAPRLPAEFTSVDDVQGYEPLERAHHADAVEAGEPELFHEEGPGFVTRALTLLKSVTDVKKPEALESLGPTIVKWLPKAAVVAVMLTLGVTGRAYWLRTVAAPKVGTVVLESLPSGSQVIVDGQVMGLTPVTATLPAGTHRVDFKYRGKMRTIDVVLAQGRKVSELIDWSPKTVGRLQINTEPGGARVLVDNVARGVTPLTLDDVALGQHTVLLESPSGSVKRSVTIKGDEPTTLNETIYAGWLKVFAPFDITISEGSKVLRLDDRDQVMLSAGPHDVRFENRSFSYQETRHIEIQPGVTMPLSIVPPHSMLTLTTSAPAEAIIDGVSAGRTPLTDYSVQVGTRDVVLKSAAGDRRLSVAVTVKPVVLDVDMSKP